MNLFIITFLVCDFLSLIHFFFIIYNPWILSHMNLVRRNDFNATKMFLGVSHKNPGQYFVTKKKMFFAHINWITFTTKQNKTNVYSFSQLSAKYYCDFHVSSLHTNDNCVQFVVFKTVSSEFPKTDRSTQKQTDQQPRTMRLHLFFWLLKTDRLTKKRYADAWVETNAARRRLSRNNP